MSGFGKRVVGQKAYDESVRRQKGGGDTFGKRVRSAIPDSGPTNQAKRNSEVGARVIDGAHESNTKGEKGGVAIEDLKRILNENPTFFDSLFEAELARPGGARVPALKIFQAVELGIKGQGRQDVLNDIAELLGEKGVRVAAAEANFNARHGASARAMEQRNRENRAALDAQSPDRSEHLEDVDGPSGPTDGQIDDGASGASGVSVTDGAAGTHPTRTGHESVGKDRSAGVPEGEGENGESGSDDEPQDFEKMTVADLKEHLGPEAVKEIKGSGADGDVVKADLVRAAKRLEKKKQAQARQA